MGSVSRRLSLNWQGAAFFAAVAQAIPGFSVSLTSVLSKAAPRLIGVAAMAALVFGWLRRDEDIITPKSGIGYWMGIVGALMMLALLGYSYRKRHPMERRMGSVPTWFRIHMLLGIGGPLLVVFHSNFHLGALNSNVALLSMLIVAMSGVIGRYIYGKIHMGLYGRKAELADIRRDIGGLRDKFDIQLGGKRSYDHFFKALEEFADQALEPAPATAVESFFRGASTVFRSAMLMRRLRPSLRELVRHWGDKQGWSRLERCRREASLRGQVKAYMAAVEKAAELRFFERLFGAWHVLHLPLFFLLVSSALVHVWAVHRY